MVRRPPRERKIPGSNPACAGIFSGSSHTSDLNIGTPVATLLGALRYRVSAGAGWPGVSILWLGEMESLICSFYLSVAACKIVQIRPWDTLACCWDIKQSTNKQTTSDFVSFECMSCLHFVSSFNFLSVCSFLSSTVSFLRIFVSTLYVPVFVVVPILFLKSEMCEWVF